MNLQAAVKYVCDNYVGLNSSARGRFNSADGWYDYDLVKSADDYCSGFISGHTTSVAYQVYRSRGADAVLKKLGSNTDNGKDALLIASGVNSSRTINISSYTDDINSVTVNDFIIQITNINAYMTSWGHPSDTHGPATSNNFNPVTCSYSGGNLNITVSIPTYSSGTYGQTGGGNCKLTPTANIYFLKKK